MNVRLLALWALNAVALLLLPELIPDLGVDSYAAALVGAILLGLANALIRPILILITLPVTLLTFGLFALVINALLFWAVSSLIGGLHVPEFGTAFWSALLYSLLTWLVNKAVGSPASRLHR
ncbi:phage holin family protein [Azoarcus sp. TTM-91]|uniref:phage holin family protein n=1 Tax=Azoarcus sp. TTM-91 TaxID=2691581 RepID=UPI00145D21D7|nr:phage holin family protein [Azoarcus sp. TTM-91]NMG34634.1 phage holin family protein [Azoarcus sp. TTM-91]